MAVFATFIWLVGAAARPRDALLGRIQGHDGFYKLHRHAESKSVPGVVIYLLQGPIIFFNCDYLRNRIRWIVNRVPVDTRHFILDASASNLLDSTGVVALSEIAADLARRGITFSVAELHNRPRILLERGASSTRSAAIMCSINSSMRSVLWRSEANPTGAEITNSRCFHPQGSRADDVDAVLDQGPIAANLQPLQ